MRLPRLRLPLFLISSVLLSATGLCGATAKPGDAAATAKADKGDKKQAPPAAAVEDIRFDRSLFIDVVTDSKIGKDIFFPNTKRLIPAVVKPTDNAQPVKQEPTALAQLVLKGISGPPNRRLALINTRTMSQGETWEIKLNGKMVRVKCEEIRNRSVIVSQEGFNEKKEIYLREGL
jgi:hypothetical protein